MQAYIDQVNYSYNGGSNAFHDVFGNVVNWAGAYLNGFPGNLVATGVLTDGGNKVTATSVAYQGMNNATPNLLQWYEEQGAMASMEDMGASPWDAGHYMNSTDTEPGHKLIVISQGTGNWLANYSTI